MVSGSGWHLFLGSFTNNFGCKSPTIALCWWMWVGKRSVKLGRTKWKTQNLSLHSASGGHTSEILRLVCPLSAEYRPRVYVVADTDKMSEEKINALEQERSSKQGSDVCVNDLWLSDYSCMGLLFPSHLLTCSGYPGGGGGGGGGRGEGRGGGRGGGLLPHGKVGACSSGIFVLTPKRYWKGHGLSSFNPQKVPKNATYRIGNARFVIKTSFCYGSSLHWHLEHLSKWYCFNTKMKRREVWHPKQYQNPRFWPLSGRTSIHDLFIWEPPSWGAMLL